MCWTKLETTSPQKLWWTKKYDVRIPTSSKKGKKGIISVSSVVTVTFAAHCHGYSWLFFVRPSLCPVPGMKFAEIFLSKNLAKFSNSTISIGASSKSDLIRLFTYAWHILYLVYPLRCRVYRFRCRVLISLHLLALHIFASSDSDSRYYLRIFCRRVFVLYFHTSCIIICWTPLVLLTTIIHDSCSSLDSSPPPRLHYPSLVWDRQWASIDSLVILGNHFSVLALCYSPVLFPCVIPLGYLPSLSPFIISQTLFTIIIYMNASFVHIFRPVSILSSLCSCQC